jgi:hypothetical protein
MRPTPLLRKRPSVFVIHSAQDTWVAQRIADGILRQGAEAFLAEELNAGEDFPTAVHSAMLRATEVLVYLTPWALDRPWVWMEVGAAWALGLLMVCVLHGLTPEDLRLDTRVPLPILARQSISINELGSEYERQLHDRVERAT